MDPKRFRQLLPEYLELRPRGNMNLQQKRKFGIKAENILWQAPSKPCSDCERVVPRVISYSWNERKQEWKKKCENCGKKRF